MHYSESKIERWGSTIKVRTHARTTKQIRNGGVELIPPPESSLYLQNLLPRQRKQFSCYLHSTWGLQYSYTQRLVRQVPLFSTKLDRYIILFQYGTCPVFPCLSLAMGPVEACFGRMILSKDLWIMLNHAKTVMGLATAETTGIR